MPPASTRRVFCLVRARSGGRVQELARQVAGNMEGAARGSQQEEGRALAASSCRDERRGARGDRNPTASVGDYNVGDAQSAAPMSDRSGRDQLRTLNAGRAQEVHFEINGGEPGAGRGNRLYRGLAGALFRKAKIPGCGRPLGPQN